MSQELIAAFVDIREEEVRRIAAEMLESGADPMAVLEAGREALEIIGQRFEAGQAFVPELIMAGEIMAEITALVKPKLEQTASNDTLGKVLIGTVEGDIHDIGKDVVVFMLDANGFDVVDLGVDVPPQTFVEKVKEEKPDVVALSGLLTLAYQSMKETVDALKEAGLREQVKIMIGGAPVDDHVRVFSGADAWGKDAMEAVAFAKQWTGGQK